MKRKKYFEGRVALAAVKGQKIIAQVPSEYGAHLKQIRQWKEHLLSVLPELFSDWRKRTDEERNQVEDELYRQISQLKVENEWLKKTFGSLSRREEAVGR
ncbi:MAG TPA: hypothetical protein DFI01_08545 [Bacteroidales bacterium]|nr:hypothetical protein [Bacteroidales bacterium]